MSTKREGGRLFPAITWDHGWSLSLQGDRYGYQCSPSERFDTLEEYEALEAVIYGPFHCDVDPSTLDLPENVVEKFIPLEVSQPSIGCRLTWDDIAAVKLAIQKASLTPNAGVPRGEIGWSLREVFHGTSLEAAENIANSGIDTLKSVGGYFGRAFYVAEEEELARSNYADFSGDEDGGIVMRFEIKDGAHILDMRNMVDADLWAKSGLANAVGAQGFAEKAVNLGIDGVYDRSVGGLAIFNPEAVDYLGPALLNRPGFR